MKQQQKQINSYLLSPKNLLYSSDEKSVSDVSEKDLIVGNFIDFINGLQEPCTIEMVRDYEDLLFHKTIQSCKFDRVILNTPEDIKPILEQYDIQYTKTNTRKWDIQKEYPDYCITEEGLYCKTYVLSVIPGELQPGWIYSVYAMADTVKMHIKPINKDKQKSVINNHKSSKLSEASTTDLVNTDDILAIRELVLKKTPMRGYS